MKNVSLFLFFLFIMPIGLMTNALAINEAKVFDKPQRELSVILTESGYYPDHLVAFEGERLKLFVTSTMSKPECLVVEDHKIFLEASKGKITSGESVFNKAGKYKFYCPSSKFHGFITVLEKRKEEKEPINIIPSREVASDKPAYWLPRNYD